MLFLSQASVTGVVTKEGFLTDKRCIACMGATRVVGVRNPTERAGHSAYTNCKTEGYCIHGAVVSVCHWRVSCAASVRNQWTGLASVRGVDKAPLVGCLP